MDETVNFRVKLEWFFSLNVALLKPLGLVLKQILQEKKKKFDSMAFQAASFKPYISSLRWQKESVSINTRTHRKKAAARNVGQRVGGVAVEKTV